MRERRQAPPGSDSIFADLSEALVEEMLSDYKQLGQQITCTLVDVNNQKDRIHAALKDKGLLRDDATVIRSLMNPTSCGMDGSRAIERLMSTDIVAIGAR